MWPPFSHGPEPRERLLNAYELREEGLQQETGALVALSVDFVWEPAAPGGREPRLRGHLGLGDAGPPAAQGRGEEGGEGLTTRPFPRDVPGTGFGGRVLGHVLPTGVASTSV